MKTILLAIACILCTHTHSAAQEKLWTWKPENGKAHHVLHGIAMHQTGAAAFVVSEFESTRGNIKFLIVWLNKNGKARMVRKIEANGYPKAENAVDVFYPAAFSVSFLGDDAIAVFPIDNNGASYKVRIYKFKGEGPPKLTLLEPNLLLFGTSQFAGWVEKGSKVRTYNTSWSGFETWYEDLEALTAWKL